MTRNKVFILGIDGGTLELVKPWAKQGKLPTFAKIMENGVYGELMSTIQPISAASWSSFATGKNPGKHGILDFVKSSPYNYDVEFVNAHTRSGKTLWKILSEHDFTVGVMNVPVTFPPETVNGFLTAGMLSPSLGSSFTFPDNLYREIKQNIGEYIIDVDVSGFSGRDKRDIFLAKVMEMMDNRRATMKYLYDKHKPEFFCIAFVATDRISHNFWKYMDADTPLSISTAEREKYGDAILNVYIKIDDILEEVLSMLDDESTLFIVSDHGFGPVHKTVSVHRWLQQQGFMKMKGSFLGLEKSVDTFIRRIQEGMPVGLKGFVKKWIPSAANTAASRASYSGIDWSQTSAYPVGHFSDIFINVKGRQPEGIVEWGKKYESLRDVITEKLYTFTDPDTGENLVEKVYKREELYCGEYLEEMPDLIIGWKGYKYLRMFNFPPSDDESVIWTIPPTLSLLWDRTGGHRPNGIFMTMGPNIKSGVEIQNANIMDIAPTALYQMNVPVPDDMDGVILTDIFDEEYLRLHPTQMKETEKSDDAESDEYSFSEDDHQKIEKRLKDLGYLG